MTWETNNIDEEKLKRMIVNILEIEKKNSKSKRYSDAEMIKKIQKIVEEEIGCL